MKCVREDFIRVCSLKPLTESVVRTIVNHSSNHDNSVETVNVIRSWDDKTRKSDCADTIQIEQIFFPVEIRIRTIRLFRKRLYNVYGRRQLNRNICIIKQNIDFMKERSMIKLLRAGDLTGKLPLKRPRARWIDRIEKIPKKLELEMHWRELALDREQWSEICLS